MKKDGRDNETGEKVQKFSTNAETGEPEIEKTVKRKRFQVPGKYLNKRSESDNRRSRWHVPEERFEKYEIRSSNDRRKIQCAKQFVSPMIFMLPTLIICPAWTSILCLLCEAYVHIWTHKRNSREKSGLVEYRSPLHLMSSQFCVHCRSQRWMEKISQIQDKRTLRRKISYSNVFRKALK